jgi:hypothetical protein
MHQLGPYQFGQYQMLYPQPINIPNLLFINDLNKKNIEYTKQLKKVHIFYSEFRIHEIKQFFEKNY